MLALTGAKSLKLARNPLGGGGTKLLVDELVDCAPELQTLKVADNRVALTGARALGTLLEFHTRIRSVDVHWNYIASDAAADLFRGVARNAEKGLFLEELDIPWNGLGAQASAQDEGLQCLARALASPKSKLYHLDLSYNSLSVEMCQALADALKHNHVLFGLHLAGNAARLDPDGFVLPGEDATVSTVSPNALKRKRERKHGSGVREADMTEDPSGCWICEGWQEVALEWPDPSAQHVFMFCSVDGFGRAVRCTPGPTGHTGYRIPPRGNISVIWQVDGEMKLHPEWRTTPADARIRPQRTRPHETDRPAVYCAEASLVPSGASLGESLPRNRPQCGACVPRCVPREVETEPPAAPSATDRPPFDITRSVFAGWLTADGHDRVCCAADWGQSKAGALCYDRPRSYEPSSGSAPPTAPEEAAVFNIVAPQYEKLVWLFKSAASRAATRAAPGSVLGLGLNPYTELLQTAGLIDDTYLTTKQSDSIFLACRAGSRARGIKTGNDKALSRPLFLEAVVRIANAYVGKFADTSAQQEMLSVGLTPRTPRNSVMPLAVDYVCEKLLAVAVAQTKDRESFLTA